MSKFLIQDMIITREIKNNNSIDTIRLVVNNESKVVYYREYNGEKKIDNSFSIDTFNGIKIYELLNGMDTQTMLSFIKKNDATFAIFDEYFRLLMKREIEPTEAVKKIG